MNFIFEGELGIVEYMSGSGFAKVGNVESELGGDESGESGREGCVRFVVIFGEDEFTWVNLE